jgi:hypothetical protein
MGNLPTSRIGQLEWFESRISDWTTNATLIGLTSGQVTSLAGTISDARAAYDAAQVARNASKDATGNWHIASNKMRDPGRAYIAAIKAYAETTNNPSVYTLASIDPPAPPTPASAPAVPTSVTGSVSPTGVVTVSWEATPSGPSSGIIFMVQRKRQGEAGWTVIGATQEKAFLDPSANVAAGNVSYQLRAQRGALHSGWTTPITFDIDNSGGFSVAFEGQNAKAAA